MINLEPEDAPFADFSSLEAWEAWLAANHPEEAARYLNPRPGPDADCDWCDEWKAALAPGDPERQDRLAPLLWPAENDWAIDDHRFTPAGLIPYDPAFAAEIQDSIQEFMEAGGSPDATTTPQSADDTGGVATYRTEGPGAFTNCLGLPDKGASVTIRDALSDAVIGTGEVTLREADQPTPGGRWECTYTITATVSSTPDTITVQIDGLPPIRATLSNGGYTASGDLVGGSIVRPDTTTLGESATTPVPVDTFPPSTPPPPPPSEPPSPPPSEVNPPDQT